jgi:isoquinoline 1-oxidoreductase beta subunit
MNESPTSSSTDEGADLARRRVLKAGGSLSIAFFLMGVAGPARAIMNARRQSEDAAAAASDGSPAFAPNAFIRIDTDGTVRLVMPNVEMGQGIYTGASMLLAEELGVGLDQIKVEHAPASDELYGNPIFYLQVTGGSTSTRGGWKILREAGAVARTMLVAAAAARWKVHPATCRAARGRITHSPSDRSLGFGELASAAAKLPQPAEVKLKDRKEFVLIGKPMRRVDTAGKVNGTTQFGLDVRLPGLKVGTVMTCPSFGGRLISVDDTHARAIPGVIDVIRLDNAVAVIGEHFWAAKKGMGALRIEWDRGVNAHLTTEDLRQSLARSSREGAAIVARQVGSPKPGGKTIESVYELPLLAHAPMEPLNTTVSVTPDSCDIWTGTQVAARAQAVAAKVTGLPLEKIKVYNQYLGGGFGRRLEVDSIEQAVAIAKHISYPVKIVWTREEDIRHDYVRPMYYDRIAATLDTEGYPAFWLHRVTGASVAARWLPAALRKNGLDSDTVENAEEPPYALPNLRVEWVRHDMPAGLDVGWWRGVGATHNLFVVESFIDELAHAAGKSPLDYRRHLLKGSPRTLAVLNLAADKMDMGQPLPARHGRGIAVGEAFGSPVCAIVEVEVSAQGHIALRRVVTAVDCGIAVNPNSIEAQMQGGLIFGLSAALYNGITVKDGAIEQSNFHDYRTLRINETPPIDVYIVEGADVPGGLGEVGTAVAAPALGNAIFAATGIRVRNLPFDRTSLVVDGGAGKKTTDAGSRDDRELRA